MAKRVYHSNATARRLMRLGAVAWIAVLIGLPANAGPTAADGKDPGPTLTLRLSSLKAAYADLKFVFDLVGDPNGYRDFQETLGLALDGIATDRPCEISIRTTVDGLQTVGYLPAVTEEDFRKFLKALEDVDVRTASMISAALRDKLKAVNLQPNERIIVSTYEGFLRFDDGYIRLGHDLNAVRGPHVVKTAGGSNAAAVIRINEAARPEVRRAAFDNSRRTLLERLKKEADQTDAKFAHQKALIDCLLSAAGLIFAETSDYAAEWSTSHAKKQSTFDAKLVPGRATSLAHDFDFVRRQQDVFAGVSRQGTVLSISWHLPLNEVLIRPLKSVTESSRELARSRSRGQTCLTLRNHPIATSSRSSLMSSVT